MRLLSTQSIGFALILVFGQAVFAASAKRSPEELFAAGTAAFADGRYEQALESFKAAEAAGLDTTALRYNLGVTYFKLKRYWEAWQQFEHLTTAPEVDNARDNRHQVQDEVNNAREDRHQIRDDRHGMR